MSLGSAFSQGSVTTELNDEQKDCDNILMELDVRVGFKQLENRTNQEDSVCICLQLKDPEVLPS